MWGCHPASAHTLPRGGTSLVPCCKKDNHHLPPKTCWGEGGLCALACSVPATLTVLLRALGLRLPGLRGHWVWGCHMANPPSIFATACGCHRSGAISNKRHSLPPCPPVLGSPQHPLPHRVHHRKVLAVWGNPWDVGSTPVSGLAVRLALPTDLARPTMTPHKSTHPPPPASRLRTEQGVSQGLGSPRAMGPHPATGSGWIQPLVLGMESRIIA